MNTYLLYFHFKLPYLLLEDYVGFEVGKTEINMKECREKAGESTRFLRFFYLFLKASWEPSFQFNISSHLMASSLKQHACIRMLLSEFS